MNKDDTESDEVCARAREHMLLGLWGRGQWGAEGRGVCVCVCVFWAGSGLRRLYHCMHVFFILQRAFNQVVTEIYVLVLYSQKLFIEVLTQF